MKKYLKVVTLFLFVLLTSCGAYFNQPFKQKKARIGENTFKSESLLENIVPVEQTIVGVYKFRDQTGQYKPVENGSTFSTAVTQGGTSILLKSLEDSEWFNPIERENIGNLLNERQIIRSTRQEYSKDNKNQTTSIPPLLFAGIILEGGVVSYDSNIITGGTGARYFGVGASTQYREDRITVYLRAVSTSSGRILKNVYVSKTILSQGISANLFRYVKLQRLLEVETGVTKNEPAQLAVKEAIDKAVELLITEGIIDGLWAPKGGAPVVEIVKERYLKEKAAADATILFDRKLEDRRGESAINVEGGATFVSNDYPNSTAQISANVSYKFYFNEPKFNLNVGLGYFQLENEGVYKEDYMNFDINLGYDILPYDDLTPFVYAGIGTITDLNLENPLFKFQYGLGIEYLPVNNIGIKLFGEQNLLFSDKQEGIVQGKYNDYYWRVGIGLNFYLGRPYNRVDSQMF